MLVREDLLPSLILLLESPNADHKYLRQLCENTFDIVLKFIDGKLNSNW